MTQPNEPEGLVFLSAEQYRERFGHDPEPADPSTERYPGYWHGWDQPGPPPSVIVVMGEHGGTGLWNRSPAQDVQRELGARGLVVQVRYHGGHEPGPDEQ